MPANGRWGLIRNLKGSWSCKGKISPVRHNPPSGEGMCEWRYSSMHSYFRHWMGVGGQLHAPAALPP
jgi:hypothetical protein